MSDTLSGEQMQAKIQAARREAEGLKDRIKRKKDELADTSRAFSPPPDPAYPFKVAMDGWTVASLLQRLNCL
jgi:hypothetical protein